ncbi:hypothetical protein [Streptomyces adustus]
MGAQVGTIPAGVFARRQERHRQNRETGPLTAAWRSLWTGPPQQIDRIDAAHIAADQAGTYLGARSPLADGLRGLLHTVETANGPVLRAAVRACTKGERNAGEAADGTRGW